MGKKIVIDSNVLIYYSKNQLSFSEIYKEYSFLYISLVSYIEVLGFNFSNVKEYFLIQNFINKIEVIPIDKNIADISVTYKKIKKIKTPDAIILATSKKLNSDLLTRNVSDFKNINPNIKLVMI